MSRSGAAPRAAVLVSNAEANRRNGAKSRGVEVARGQGLHVGLGDRPASTMIRRPWSPTEALSMAAVVHLRAMAAKLIRLQNGPVATSHRSRATMPHARGLLPGAATDSHPDSARFLKR